MTTVAMVAGMIAGRHRLGRGQRFPRTHGHRRDRRTDHLHALTLVIVPAVFTVLDDIERWIAPKAGKLLAERSARRAHAESVV